MEDEFEEDLNLIPLTLTIIKHETLSTRISLFTGISLITTSVIGSGIVN